MSRSTAFIHPKAIVDSPSVGEGTRVWAFAHVCKGAVVGRNCNLGDGCFLEGGSSVGNNVTVKNGVMIWEGVTVEDDVFLGPGVIFTNDLHPRSPRLELVHERYATRGWLSPTRVARGAAIGANAIIGCGITIGEFAMIGAGSMVTRDVAPFSLVYGNPARHQGYVSACGRRLHFVKNRARCPQCGGVYRKSAKGGVSRG